MKLAERSGGKMRRDAETHDVVLARGDGPNRKFRIYGRPMPGIGEVITLPVDGQLIRARVTVCSKKPAMGEAADAEVVELVR
jgi:hypothetical protein